MSSLHQPYPWHYPNARLLVVEVDCDFDALRKAVDSSFDLVRPGKAVIWALECEGIAGVGAYRELMVNVLASYKGRIVTCTPFIYVDNDAAMASGREVLGLDKKFCEAEQGYFSDQLIARFRRSGVDFATVGMTLDREGTVEDRDRWVSNLSQTSANRVGDSMVFGQLDPQIHRVVHGRGFVETRPSAADPLYRLRPIATSATLVEGSWDLTVESESPREQLTAAVATPMEVLR